MSDFPFKTFRNSAFISGAVGTPRSTYRGLVLQNAETKLSRATAGSGIATSAPGSGFRTPTRSQPGAECELQKSTVNSASLGQDHEFTRHTAGLRKDPRAMCQTRPARKAKPQEAHTLLWHVLIDHVGLVLVPTGRCPANWVGLEASYHDGPMIADSNDSLSNSSGTNRCIQEQFLVVLH